MMTLNESFRMPGRVPQQVIDAAIRTDFYSFIQAFFSIVFPGQLFLDNFHIEAIAYALIRVMRGEIRRLIITVPPRTLKSLCTSVAFPAFLLGHDPTRRIICVSYSEGLAAKHANDCRALMHSPKYRRIFPTRISRAKDTELEIMTTARGFRLATSVGGTLTGRGGNIIIIDDPQKPQDAQSQSAREQAQQWHTNTLLSRLDNKSSDAIVLVMQRLHQDDLAGYLLRQGGWEHLNLPAVAEVEQQIPLAPGRFHPRSRESVLHPERESRAVLDELRREMGSAQFSAQYQQCPVPAEGRIVNPNWLRTYDQEPVIGMNDKLIISWDTAMSSSELSNYSACVVGVVKGESIYILQVIRDRLDFPALRRKVIEIYRRWQPAARNCSLLIENKGSGQSLIQQLQHEGIPVVAIQPEGDKIMRLSRNTPRIEGGCVYLPFTAPWLEDFELEISAFPGGAHDDQVDAFSQLLDRVYRPPQNQARFGYW
jgi:predicted phage terminase large subunit-like protein